MQDRRASLCGLAENLHFQCAKIKFWVGVGWAVHSHPSGTIYSIMHFTKKPIFSTAAPFLFTSLIHSVLKNQRKKRSAVGLFPGHPLWSRLIKIHRHYGTTYTSSCCLSFFVWSTAGVWVFLHFTSARRHCSWHKRWKKVLGFQSDQRDRGSDSAGQSGLIVRRVSSWPDPFCIIWRPDRKENNDGSSCVLYAQEVMLLLVWGEKTTVIVKAWSLECGPTVFEK